MLQLIFQLITAKYECNPNYAIYFSNLKDINLVEFENIIKTMSQQERIRFAKETAEKYIH